MGGKNDDEKVKNLIKAIQHLKKEIGIPMSIREAGVDEKTFKEGLSQLSELAFDDQCTGANPRYPLIKEIEEMQRKITELEEGLRRIEYLTEEKYQDYLFMFALLMVVLLPVLSVAAARIGYFCYNRYIQRKAKEFFQ